MPIRRSPSAAGSAKQPGSRSSIRLSTHVGRPMMELFEVGFAVRSDRLSPSHGENRGSSPLGSASEIKYILKMWPFVSNRCPINICGQAWTPALEHRAHTRRGTPAESH